MDYAHNTEIHRWENAIRERDPIENAFRAFICLSPKDKQKFITRHNSWSSQGCEPWILTYEAVNEH